mgnify:CR=1 FL=1
MIEEFEPTLFDDGGEAEWVFVGSRPTEEGWLASSLDVVTYRPLSVGDRVVALDFEGPDRFLVEVVAVTNIGSTEVFYRLRHLADLDPAADMFGTPSWRPSD